MSLSDELRAQRIRKLHSSFLAASEKHPKTFHVACRSDNRQVQDLLSLRHYEALSPTDPSAPEGQTIAHEREEVNRVFWLQAARLTDLNLGSLKQFFDKEPPEFGTVSRPFKIGSDTWLGRFHWSWMGGYDEFDRLAREAAHDFCGSGHDVADWLGLLYSTFPENRRATRYEAASIEGEVSVQVAWLSWDVFLTSAKAIEELAQTDARTELSGRPLRHTEGAESAEPVWDSQRRELRFRGKVCKRFRQKAGNQQAILEAFQVEGWPPRIDDPLPFTRDGDREQRLRDALKGLNRNEEIRFEADGTTKGILWNRKDTGSA